MKEILAANGWHWLRNCASCSGNAEFWGCNYTQEYVIKIFTRGNYYLLIKNNAQIHRGNVNDIQAKITEVRNAVPA